MECHRYWKNVGRVILNGLGMIPVVGEAFDMANAIWYAKDGQYGMAALSLMSALPMIGNVASGVMTAAKLTTAAKIVSTACKVVSNAATFTQAAIGGISNAASIGKNILNGKLFSEDTAKNLVSFGINAFTAATSGKNLLSSSKELKKAVGDGVGNKWSRKAGKEPLLEYNLQFFAEKNEIFRELILNSEKTHESARNTLISELKETGAFKNGSKSYVGRLESSYGYGKQIGRQSLDGKVRWRLDFDEKIGVHYNIENFLKGKGTKAIKKVIPIDINYGEYIRILKSWN